jgi:hypothetical protein
MDGGTDDLTNLVAAGPFGIAEGRRNAYRNMPAVHWVEILKCQKCGKAGLAELWDDDA